MDSRSIDGWIDYRDLVCRWFREGPEKDRSERFGELISQNQAVTPISVPEDRE